MTFPNPLPSRRRLLGGVALLMLAAVAVPDAAAQSSSSASPVSQVLGVALYRYAEPGQPVITVDMMGTIKQPGRYLVPPEMKLLDVLALSGGVTASTESDQTVQSITVELSRAGEGGRSVAFNAPIEDLTNGRANPPPLVSGDVVTVTTVVSSRFDWIDGLTVAGSVATIALVILRIAQDI